MRIKDAMGLIKVPNGIMTDIEKGIDRAVKDERRPQFKMIAAAAAALVLIGGAAFIFSDISLNKAPVTYTNDDGYVFLGIDVENKNAVVGMKNESGGLGNMTELSDYRIEDAGGAEVMTFMFQYSWLDEADGSVHVVDLPTSGTLYADGGGKTHYELETDFENIAEGIEVQFSLKSNYVGSVEDGTAIDADAGNISLSFDDDGGREALRIALSDKKPFSDIVSIRPSCFRVFDEAGKPLGAYAEGDTAGETTIDGGGWKLVSKEGSIYIDGSGSKGTLYICAFRAALGDGSEVEIHGDWLVEFGE